MGKIEHRIADKIKAAFDAGYSCGFTQGEAIVLERRSRELLVKGLMEEARSEFVELFSAKSTTLGSANSQVSAK